jgi:hypothetical protein
MSCGSATQWIIWHNEYENKSVYEEIHSKMHGIAHMRFHHGIIIFTAGISSV